MVLQKVWNALAQGWQWLACGLANLRRRWFRSRLPDYTVIVLNQPLTERPPARPWWYAFLPGMPPPLSLADLSDALWRIAADPDVKGAIILLKAPPLAVTQAQSLAMLFDRFRTWDRQFHGKATPRKRVVVHLEHITRALYVAACAADQVVVTPLTSWDVVGLYTAPTFWKQTLARAGVQMDVVKVAPWKTAFDRFSEAEMSPAYAEQTQWLYDSLYANLLESISRGRNLPVETVATLINEAPWTAEEALAANLVDAIAYEDELPALLGAGAKPARLKLYRETRGLLFRRPPQRSAQAVGVISLAGAIMPGQSRSFPVPLPLFGDEVLGHLTAQQQIRAARTDRRLAAVVVYVDSPGGSALASDLIWRELQLLNDEKPVVVYMGAIAGSGGYYIALPSRAIVAQPATLTGSIGVITAKPVLQEAYAKLQANRYAIQRGQNADLFREDRCWDERQRAKIEASVRHNYDQFKQRVAGGRNLPLDGLDAICSGKVWTGAQALAHGLVDALGDFHVAVERAAQLANLPGDVQARVIDLTPPKRRLLAEPAQMLKQTLGLRQTESWAELTRLLVAGDWQTLLQHEHHWWLSIDQPPDLF